MAAVAAAIAGAFAAETAVETFTDTRDGQTYKTVKIGRQTWMAKNLNYQMDSSWCCRDSSWCNEYGRLYNWDAAMKACPVGWRLPSRQDWFDLGNYAGGKIHGLHEDFIYGSAEIKLKATSGWGENEKNRERKGNGCGTDNYGFSALPGGYRLADGSFYAVSVGGYWWTSTQDSRWGPYLIEMHSGYNYLYGQSDKKEMGYSVRCVADAP
jgi:uncharacterized protein (TIGR02145 family)